MRKYIFFASFLLICLSIQAQTMVFVSSAATDDTGDGSSWETAKQTISAALTEAGTDGVVFIMAGDYAITEELMIPVGVTVKGGYQQISVGTDTTLRRLPGVNMHWTDNAWCTIITGKGDHRIATVNGVLDGCVVRNGYSSTIGGGLLIDGSNAVVRYCVIKECDAIDDDDYNGEGGGAYIRNNGVLINSIVTECRADNGVGVTGEDGYLINNTITRNAPIGCGYVIDYDGNYYDAVLIGKQCWMKQNLRVTHFADGNTIPQGTGYHAFPCYYENTSLNLAQYGLHYNWYAAMKNGASSNNNPSGVQGICPDGWHLPSYAEWDELVTYVSSQPRFLCNNNGGYYGKALASKIGWNTSNSSCNIGAENASYSRSTNNGTRFTGMPGGNWDSYFRDVNYVSYFWTSTQYNDNQAYYRYLSYSDRNMGNTSNYKDKGYQVRCLRDPQLASTEGQTVPVVTTAAVANVSANSATGGGNVTADGGSVVTARGVCWSTTENPTVNDSHTTDGSGVGNFNSTITGLTANTTYYVRAYATNAIGTAYGESVSITTGGQPCPGAPTVTDVDGNTYATVQIGQQCWMKENLRTKHYSGGGNVDFKYPNNTPATQSTYGLLYNWATVMNGALPSNGNPSYVTGICPNGWHVPSQSEWDQLRSYVGSLSTCRCDNNANYVAKALAATNGWSNYNYSSCYPGYNQTINNATGFSAVPAGFFRTDTYYEFSVSNCFWSTTQYNNERAYRRNINYNSSELGSLEEYKDFYFSVRCVKD